MKNIKTKKSGTYYTPRTLSDFIIYHIFTNYTFGSSIDVLEPSAGDGIFFDSLFAPSLLGRIRNVINIPEELKLTAVELDSNALESLKQKNYQADIQYFGEDYLEHHLTQDKKFDLIVGNPPYIKSSHLSKKQIKACEAIHKNSGLSLKKIKNIWTSFLVGGVQSLKGEGVLCFVLPSELLQVMYAKELREFLKEQFKHIEIFAFNELVFPDIEQDVVILICTKQPPLGVSFYHVNTLKDLEKPEYVKEHSNIHRETLDKWTNYILTDKELKFLDRLKADLLPIKHYSRAEVGVVTAANDYFIVDEETLVSRSLQKISKPMIQKGMHLTPGATFTKADLKIVRGKSRPSFFLAFEDKESAKFSRELKDYLKEGQKRSIHTRYKCLLRNNWYHVPSTWVSDGFFTKRSNVFPRTIVNDANTLVTDSFYRVKMNEGYDIHDLVFSFYNTLTFIFAELEGRYYGGSVLELMPNEYKNLAIPYCEGVEKSLFDELDRMLREKHRIKDILLFTDKVILQDYYHLTNDEVVKLQEIYNKLLKRRLKGKSPDA